MVDEQAFQMQVAIGFAGAVMTVVPAERREFFR
jgi:hypothetical protein